MTSLPLSLVGDGLEVPCVDGADRPYLSLDSAASTSALPAGRRAGGRLPAVVLERAPRRRLQVADGHRRLRGGPRRGPALRRPRRTRRRRHHRAQHHRGHQPPGLPAAAHRRRRDRHDRHRAPRQPAAVGPHRRPPPLRRVRPDGTLHRRRGRGRARRRRRGPRCWPSPAPPTSPAGCRRSTRSSPPPTSAACRCSSTRPSSRRTGRCRPRPTSSRGAGTRCTRRSAPAC